MAGVSFKAAGALVNKDKTFQGQKFDDDLGINYYSFKWRNHDPQLGRFIEIDPLAEDYEFNSTYTFSENKVTSHIELEGLESIPLSRDLWQAAQTLPPQAKAVAAIGIGLFALGELIFENPEALSGGGKSQSYPATFDLYIKSGEHKINKGSQNPNTKESAEVGQEAHRQIQKELKKDGAQTEVPMTLKDGTNVRKDAVKEDGTPVIIKPDTKTGKASAEKRKDLLIKNDVKTPDIILYNPNDLKYKPGSPSYIGPKNRK